jgi:hypothetical protein
VAPEDDLNDPGTYEAEIPSRTGVLAQPAAAVAHGSAAVAGAHAGSTRPLYRLEIR